MHTKRISEHLYCIDLKPAGIEKFISSYVLKAEKAAIVETGPTVSAEYLLMGLDEIGVNKDDVAFVAVSHIHADHGGGAGTLLKNLPNAKLILHPRGVPHMVNPEKLWVQTQQVLGYVARIYGKMEPVPEKRMLPAFNGMKIDLGDTIQLRILETLGHASHHLCFYENENSGVFSGDAGGIYLPQFDAILPTTPPPFHLQTALGSINQLIQMKPDRIYYTHFGDADNAVEKLERYASQLKLWAEVVRESIARGDSLDAIERSIIEADPVVKRMELQIKHHPIMSRNMLRQNIQGFLEYFRKFNTADKP